MDLVTRLRRAAVIAGSTGFDDGFGARLSDGRSLCAAALIRVAVEAKNRSGLWG